MTGLTLFAFTSWMIFASVEAPSPPASLPLPPEPEESTRIDEIYDQESRLFLSLYSLKGNGEVDYVTGRTVQGHIRSNYGNPVYYIPEHPIFYWWNHTMWNDPLLDGVNGNELVYKEETEFDVSRYKPCLFNGQPC
ncbi:MAG: hypothetical protein V3U07_08795 [Nitrospirales bacterium]|jgi:hypothetical protein